MRLIALGLLLGHMTVASAHQFVNGSPAEVLLVNLMDLGAHVDCSRGLCTLHATRVNCADKTCALSVKVESGEYMVVSLNEEPAVELRQSLTAAGSKGQTSSIICRFPRNPDEPAVHSQCLLED